ncbi:MAG TPA: chorismate mutase [Candidatus Paceibacterota bacterium]|nr:chorismate mutase [Candidatus Paceibacterota bacterium]
MEKRDELQELRTEIDILDRNIITSLAERMELVEEIGRYKAAHNMGALDEDRRDALLKTWIETGRALSLPEDLLREIFEAIHRHSLSVEEKNKQL